MTYDMHGRRSLITESDVTELGRLLVMFTVGFLGGRAAHRAYERRRAFFEEAGSEQVAAELLTTVLP